MELEWVRLRPRDEDGGCPYWMNYLVDNISKRCFATIAEPREGNILFVTDIRVSGSDRSFIDLDAARSYCEAVALEDVIREARELEQTVNGIPSEFGGKKESSRLGKLWLRVFSRG